ncbi:hypothetical protein L226DRAFT_528172 [Lentinus tigrinus ALCF2SS1-7]|uniref:Uncharacterized protein n=1 Tax=Lentinus tigrinus ALCF2SS1-6 TaxID=1328759 RepID=A0A5C2SMM4_9APHY|nr:hypothetical protein L227DRAFT_271919 [Lentinus tigrinus ALCF2SS1-6]RPD81964.1 hypothetical protein L226DRAFT_528172 [Lentinus tigrinus ALCF2SS1-7]
MAHISVPNYRSGIKEALEGFLHDAKVSDSALLLCAREHLEVLENPAFSRFNTLPCEESPEPSAQRQPHDCTIKRVFEAMFHTADMFNMGRSVRFVSAGICACAQIAKSHDSTAEGPCIQEKMAKLLAELGWMWLVDLMIPFHECGTFHTVMSRVYQLSENPDIFSQSACFACGNADIDEKTGCIGSRHSSSGKRTHVVNIPVFRRAIRTGANSNKWASPYVPSRSLETLRNYCSFEAVTMDVSQPCNQLPMHSSASWDFEEFRWSLGPPRQNPQRYEVVRYSPHPAQCTQDVALADCGAGDVNSSAASRPNSDVLRVHAMMASVLHHSGAHGIFYPEDLNPDELPTAASKSESCSWKSSSTLMVDIPQPESEPCRSLSTGLRRRLRSWVTRTMCL